MIVVMKPNTRKEEIAKLMHRIEEQGFAIHLIQGVSYCIFGIVGDTTRLDTAMITINK